MLKKDSQNVTHTVTQVESSLSTQKRVLSVGGSDLERHPLPSRYKDFSQEVLDIDPAVKPHVLCDAREMTKLEGGVYDAIFCSHNLEHYHPHEVPNVLKGFLHMLKPDGWAEIWVPDLLGIMQEIVERKLDVEDEIHPSPAGPVLVRDIIFGFGKYIAMSGKDYYAHKMGFSYKSLLGYLKYSGFAAATQVNRKMPYEIGVIAFKQPPTKEQLAFFGL